MKLTGIHNALDIPATEATVWRYSRYNPRYEKERKAIARKKNLRKDELKKFFFEALLLGAQFFAVEYLTPILLG